MVVLVLVTRAKKWRKKMGKSFPLRHDQDQDIYRPWSRHIQIRRTPSKYFPRTSAASPASRLDNVFFPHINFAYNSHQGHTRLLTHIADLNEVLLLLRCSVGIEEKKYFSNTTRIYRKLTEVYEMSTEGGACHFRYLKNTIFSFSEFGSRKLVTYQPTHSWIKIDE